MMGLKTAWRGGRKEGGVEGVGETHSVHEEPPAVRPYEDIT